MSVDWGQLVVGQLEFYWEVHLWPRLEGLTDAEYLWEPVEGAWSVRADETGVFRFDRQPPEAVTTIAWRMAHVALGMSTRVSAFFGDGTVPDDADMFDPRHEPASLPGTAAGGLKLLEESYRSWHDAIVALDDEGLARPLGPKGAFFGEDPMAALIVHVNREVMHHGGEICLLRDLYRDRSAA